MNPTATRALLCLSEWLSIVRISRVVFRSAKGCRNAAFAERKATLLFRTMLSLWLIAPWPNLLLAEERNNQQIADAWREAQLVELDERLAKSADDAAMTEEWRARRDWIRDWKPGQMAPLPDIATNIDGKKVSDTSGHLFLTRLVDEPELANLDFEADPSLQHWSATLSRANQLQTRLRQLDTLENRKGNLIEIADVALQLEQIVRRLVDQVGSDRPDVEHDLRWVLAHTRYRRARAIAYRELPKVLESLPIEDPDAYEQQLEEAHHRLRQTFPEARPEFVLFEIRMLRRAGLRGQALRSLERFSWAIEANWYLKKRRDLLQELDWGPPHEEAAQLYQASGLANPNQQ